MLTPKDIQKLTKVLASKDDIKKLDDKMNSITNLLVERFDNLEEVVQENTVGGLKAEKQLKKELVRIDHQLNTHEKWIKELQRSK